MEETAASRCCAACETTEHLSQCSQCRAVWYCSKECQILHWKKHKKACKETVTKKKAKETERLRKENERLQQQNARLLQQQHFVTIRSSTDTSKLYACGAKDPRVMYQYPFTWPDVEEQIALRPSDPFVPCPVQDIPSAELRIGNTILNIRDADRSMLRGFRGGPSGSRKIEYMFIFENNQFASNVDIVVSVVFGPIYDWQQRGLDIRMPNVHTECHPSRFRNADVESVSFDSISFCANFADR